MLVIFISSPSTTNLERAADREPIHIVLTSNIGVAGSCSKCMIRSSILPFFLIQRARIAALCAQLVFKQLFTLTVKLRYWFLAQQPKQGWVSLFVTWRPRLKWTVDTQAAQPASSQAVRGGDQAQTRG